MPTTREATAETRGSAASTGVWSEGRLEPLYRPAFAEDLETQGYATVPGLLGPADCRALVDLFADPARFRSRVVMARHGFGQGEYQYFAYPLPEVVARLRRAAYSPLAKIANRWNESLGRAPDFPDGLDEFLARCHAAGQARPTPLMLKYGAGDYNRLHQDLYGPLHFPLQLAVLLSEPGRDFAGGEFVLAEQRPRTQTRAEVVPLGRGDGVVFAVNHRPARGARGVYRLTMHHGVSTVRAGARYCLGVIFHDAA